MNITPLYTPIQLKILFNFLVDIINNLNNILY